MSLSKCIRKAGKALDRDDAAAIKDIYTELTQGGMPGEVAAPKAVDSYIAEMQEEQQSMIADIEEQGGDVSKFRAGTLRLAAGDVIQEVSRALSLAKAIDKGSKLPGLPKKVTTRTFAQYLTKRARKANRGKALTGTTPRNKEIISEVLAQETEAAMKRSGHAGNWYSDTLGDAMSIAALMHPELQTDANARNAFLVGMAIMSNGQTVAKNTELAQEVYSYFKKHGKFEIRGEGAEALAMKKGFQLYNDLAAKWGNNRLNEFLHTEFTVAELDLLGLNVSGENKGATVYGSAIFGPKVGQAFFQNLSGNYTPLTMDRWWMRTWGRIVGNLAPEGKAELQAAKLRELLPRESDLQTNDKKLAAFAAETHKAYQAGRYKDKTPINKAAKNYDNALNDPVVAPRNGGERAWIREVVAHTLTKLKDRGMDLNSASMQALLWYPEKELYLNNGVGNERSKPTDYSIEFGKLAEQQGFSKQRVAGARSRAVNRRAAADVGAADGATARQGRGPGLAKEARQQLIHQAAARQIAELAKGAYAAKLPKGTERAVNGALAAQAHKPDLKAKNILERAGLPAPTFLQLEQNPKGAEVFRSALQKAVAGRSGAPIRIFTAEEYENMRTFLTPDGLSGFALNGEEVVSVFKHPKSGMKGVAQAMIRLAIEQGGRRLGVYDTAVPYLYAMQGFKAVSRTPMESGPDLVFMSWDRNSNNSYEPGQGKLVDSVAEAREISISESANLMTRNAPDGSILLRLGEDIKADINAVKNPASPLSQLQKLAVTVEDQSRHGPADGRTLKAALMDKVHGKNAGNIQAWLGAIPRRHLPDFVSKASMPSASRYITHANRMEGRRNELMAAQEEIGKRWNKYVGDNKPQATILGELMHGATLSGVDPSLPYKAKRTGKMSPEQRAAEVKRMSDHRILNKWWNQLDQEGQEIYVEVRNSYLKQRTRVEKALMDRIKSTEADPKSKGALMLKLRKQFESGRVAGPYFPLARFGELWASAKDAKGNTVAFSRFEQLSDQKEWLKNMKAEGYAVDSGKKMDDIAIVGQVDPAFASKVTELVKGVDTALADDIWQLYLTSMPDISIRKGFMHRKNRLGFTADAVRSFGHNMFHGAHQLAKLENVHMMETDIKNMKAEARKMEQTNDPDALWGTSVYREMVQRHQTAMNPQSSPWATKLTALGFAWYLGATPAAAAVNMSQTAIVGLPVLSAQFGYTKSAAELLRSAALYASSWGPLKNRLRGDERLAFEEADKNGLFDKTQSHDLAGVADQGMDYTSKMHTTMTIISWMFHKMEEFNRQVTFLSAYRLSRGQGASHSDSVAMGDQLTWDSHFDYGVANRPRYMQGDMARVLLLFRQYSMNMTYRMGRDFNDAIREADPVAKAQARTRFSGMMGMTMLFAGTTGLPMFWAVEGVMNAIFGDEDEPYDFVDDTRAHLAEMTSPEIADIIVKGPADYLSGATFSSRVSLNHLWLRETPAYLEGADRYLHLLGETAGPIGALAKDVFYMAPQELKEGNYRRALEYVTPKSLKDIAKTARYVDEGVRTRRGDVVISKEELSSKDLFQQSVGFTPAKVTKQYEINRAVKKAEGHILDRKRRLMDRLFLATRQEDKKEVANTLKRINRFNSKNPAYPISPGKIIASAKARARFSREAIGGVKVNKNLRYLHEKYNF